MQTVLIATEFSFILLLIACLCAALIFRRLSAEYQSISWLIFLSGTTEILLRVLAQKNINSSIVFHIQAPLGFLIIIRFYQKILQGYISTKIIQIIIFLFTFLTIVNSIFIQPPPLYNSHALLIEFVLIIILSISTFLILRHEVVKRSKSSQIKSLHWINAGLLTYYTSSLLIVLFRTGVPEYLFPKAGAYIQILEAFTAMIMQSCYLIGVCIRLRNE